MQRKTEQIAGKRVVWASDIHLDHIEPPAVQAFFDELAAVAPEALLLGGDIALADTVEGQLRELEERLQCPIYFVLGNHDYYHGSIPDLRRRMTTLSHSAERLFWMPESGVIPLTTRTGLIGHGGWGDGRAGDYWNSPLQLSDSVYIEDIAALDQAGLLRRMQELGQEGANHLEHMLPEALARFEHIIVLMHVPPFIETCWHHGRPADKDWQPFFVCHAAADVLYEAAQENAYHHITVLAGHSHSPINAHLLPNLQVKVAAAEYGQPRIQEILILH